MTGFRVGFDWTRGGEGSSTPAPTPSRVAAITGSGSAGSASGDSTLAATGNNRRILAMCGAGTSDSVNDISMTITGASGTANMTRRGFLGTTTVDPASALEAFAVFEAGETELATAGAGPYTIEATASGSNVPDKVGFIAASYQDAPTFSLAGFINSSAGLAETITVTPSAADTMMVAFGGGSTASGSHDFTAGATRFETNLGYGDQVIAGDAVVSAETTVTNNLVGRTVLAVFFLPKG